MKKYLLLGLLAFIVCTGTIVGLMLLDKNNPTSVSNKELLAPSNEDVEKSNDKPTLGPDTDVPTAEPITTPTPTKPNPDPVIELPEIAVEKNDSNIPNDDQYTMTINSQGKATLIFGDVSVEYTIDTMVTTKNSFTKSISESNNAIYNLSGEIKFLDSSKNTTFNCDINDIEKLLDYEDEVLNEIKDAILAYADIIKLNPLYIGEADINQKNLNCKSTYSMSGSASVIGNYIKSGELTFTTEAGIINNKFMATTDFTYTPLEGKPLYGYIENFTTEEDEYSYKIAYTNSKDQRLPDDILTNLIKSIKKIYDYTY